MYCYFMAIIIWIIGSSFKIIVGLRSALYIEKLIIIIIITVILFIYRLLYFNDSAQCPAAYYCENCILIAKNSPCVRYNFIMVIIIYCGPV